MKYFEEPKEIIFKTIQYPIANLIPENCKNCILDNILIKENFENYFKE